jgi:hypothetical protein
MKSAEVEFTETRGAFSAAAVHTEETIKDSTKT